MLDAVKSGQSPPMCRHLFALFLTCQDVHTLKALWEDDRIRNYLTYDFRSTDEDDNDTKDDLAEMLTLMDIAQMVYDINSSALSDCFRTRDLPTPPSLQDMPQIQSRIDRRHVRLFTEFSAIVGFIPETKTVVPKKDRELHRYRQRVVMLSHQQLTAQFAELNPDQAALFCQLKAAFENRMLPGQQQY